MSIDVDINLNLEGTEKSEALLKRMTETLEAQRQEFERINRAGRLEGLQQGEKEVQALTSRLASMANQLRSGADETDELVKGLREVAKASSLVEEKAEGAAKAVRSIPAAGGMARGGSPQGVLYAGSGTVGDVSGDVGTIASNLAGLTGNQNFAVLGGLGDVIEGTLRLRGSAEELAPRLFGQAAANTAVEGTSVAATGGVASFALALAPLAAAGAAAAGAIYLINKSSDDAEAAFVKQAEAERKRTDALIEQRRILESMDAGQIQSKISEIEANNRTYTEARDKAIENLANATNNADLAEKLREANNSGEITDALMKGFAPAGVALEAWNRTILDTDGAISAARDEVEKYKQQLEESSEALANYNAVLKEAQAIQFFNERAGELIQTQRDLAEAEEWRLDVLKQSGDTIRDNIAELERDNKRREESNRILEGRAEGLAETEQKEAYELLQAEIAANNAALDENSEKLAYLTGTALEAARATERMAAATEAFTEAVDEFERVDAEFKSSVQDRIKAQADTIRAENALAEVQAKRLEDDTRNAERARQEQSILDQIDAAKQVAAAAKVADNVAKIRDDGYAKEADITADYLNDTAKALRDYNKSVSELNRDFERDDLREIEDYNLSRFRLARDLETGLFEAARKNDVSSFITQRARGANQIGDFDTDFNKDQRRDIEDRDESLKDLRANLQAESAERANAAQLAIQQTRAEVQQRIAVEQEGAIQRITQVEILQQRLAELDALHAAEDEQRRRAEQDKALRDNAANADIRYGQALQTEAILRNQAAIAGQNVGIAFLNTAVETITRGLNAFGFDNAGRGGTSNNFNFSGMQIGAGVSPDYVKDQVRQGVQAGIDQTGKRGGTVFRIREA